MIRAYYYQHHYCVIVPHTYYGSTYVHVLCCHIFLYGYPVQMFFYKVNVSMLYSTVVEFNMLIQLKYGKIVSTYNAILKFNHMPFVSPLYQSSTLIAIHQPLCQIQPTMTFFTDCTILHLTVSFSYSTIFHPLHHSSTHSTILPPTPPC